MAYIEVDDDFAPMMKRIAGEVGRTKGKQRELLKTSWDAFKNWLKSTCADIWDAIKGVARDIWDWVKGLFV